MRSVSREEGAGGERQAASRGQFLSVEQGMGRITHLTQSMGGSTVPGIQSVYCLEAVMHSSVEACSATVLCLVQAMWKDAVRKESLRLGPPDHHRGCGL